MSFTAFLSNFAANCFAKLDKMDFTSVSALVVVCFVIISLLGNAAGNTHCTAESYPCLGVKNHCIRPDQVCDGSKDCSMGDDEFFCHIPDDGSCSGRTLCATDRACVNTSTVCDGNFDCPGHGDEIGCDLQCPSQCLCGGFNTVCAGVPWNAASASWVNRGTMNFFAMNLLDFDGTTTAVVTPNTDSSLLSVQDVLHLNFADFKQLKILNLVELGIGRLEANSFTGLKYVHTLGVYYNNITVVQQGAFRDMAHLQSLYLSWNLISDLPVGVFVGLRSLRQLHLEENRINLLRSDVFEPLMSLTLLNLMSSTVTEIEMDAFSGLSSLQHLYLSHNNITQLDPGVFEPLSSLLALHLDDNRLSHLQNATFYGLMSLHYLDLSENPLVVIEQGAFVGLFNIIDLYMVLMEADVSRLERDMFIGLESLHSLFADDHRYCCLLTHDVDCNTPPSPFATCEGLLRHTVLRMFIWILGLSAVIGNVFVIFWRYKQRHSEPQNRVQIFLILNLAVSDLIMGVYMILIGGADGYFGQDYFLYANEWRSDALCKLAGVISVVSSLASMLIITVISVDRFVCIAFPFGKFRLRIGSARITAAVVWGVSAFLSLLPNVIESYVSGFYGLSDVCMALPLATKSDYKASWLENNNVTFTFVFDEMDEKTPASYYSIFLFIALSLACFVVILICYTAIFVSVQRSSRGAARRRDRDEEIKMAAKMALIVGTDFACWMPIIVMGLLSQTGAVTIPVKTYAWTIVFVLPINSSINPYLYTISTLLARRQLRSDRSKELSQTAPLTSSSINPTSKNTRRSSTTAGTDTESTAQDIPMISKEVTMSYK